ncbi:MAG: MotA/TolQ/ExbB proton channel family protein [Rhodospirillaceae bacterium]|nr:MotA/TolQ/ExbB proton channel family protein [Rhodospirillaceae bacterium]
MDISSIISANGPFFSIVFLCMSFAGVGLVVWRIISNARAKTNVDKFVADLEAQLANGGGQAVMDLCAREATETRQIVPKLFHAAMTDGARGKIAARDAMADCIEMEIMPSLHNLLPHILLLAKVSPMVGLLGTVWGMINAFQTIAGATKVDPSALANDIGMALFTTAEGLLIAIPLIFAYTLLKERVHSFELDLARASQAAIKLLPQVYRKTS